VDARPRINDRVGFGQDVRDVAAIATADVAYNDHLIAGFGDVVDFPYDGVYVQYVDHHSMRHIMRPPVLLLQNDLHFDGAQLELILVFEHVRQVGSETLSIKKRAVGAADIFHEIRRTPLVNLAMTARDPSLKPTIGGEIEVWKNPMGRVEAPDMHFGSGWQPDLPVGGCDLEVERSRRRLAVLSLFTDPGIGARDRQLLVG
jgi:hypothetical protein